jgi:KDO2-lipid IV(A) lauroyltransferase
MDWLLYSVAKCLILVLQALPLDLVARLGRQGGRLAYSLDARHRRVARNNIARCFPDLSPEAVRDLARESFRRIGESYACGVKTASMSAAQLSQVLEWVVPDELAHPPADAPLTSVVVAIGHFSNFELYVHSNLACLRFQSVSTYRGLPQASLNRLMRDLRKTSGCLFFERRSEGAKLRAAMRQPGMILGLASDQDGGDRGVQLPFLGHMCSTSPAAALFALRYGCRLYTAVCCRVRLARWRIEFGPEIPTHEHGAPRSTAAIMSDVNAAFEVAVRRDPASWFWVHNRWKRGRPVA